VNKPIAPLFPVQTCVVLIGRRVGLRTGVSRPGFPLSLVAVGGALLLFGGRRLAGKQNHAGRRPEKRISLVYLRLHRGPEEWRIVRAQQYREGIPAWDQPLLAIGCCSFSGGNSFLEGRDWLGYRRGKRLGTNLINNIPMASW